MTSLSQRNIQATCLSHFCFSFYFNFPAVETGHC
ncbi:unnamed protein product [Brassica rapa subsp. trilocularis]